MAEPTTSRSIRSRGLAAALAAALLAAACGGSDEATSSAEVTPPLETSTETDTTGAGGTSTTTSVGGNVSMDTNTTTTVTGSGDGATGSPGDASGPPVADDAALRLAPMGADALVLLWDDEAAWPIGHTGERAKIADGPFAEVAELPGYGVVFQREPSESTIWLADADGVRDLVVAGDDQTLTLEGTGVSGADESPVVYYQRHESGDIETTRSTLRRFDFATGEVTELLETGGWESGTRFSHLAGDRLTVAATGAEGWVANLAIDLSVVPPTTSSHTEACLDGDPDCDFYERVAVIGALSSAPRTIGFAPIWDGDSIEEWGLYEFEFGGDESRLIASWPWDNAEWYVEDMFAISGNEVLLSLSDAPGTDGSPLPALIVDINTGEAHTLPAAMFARPMWLS